MMPWALITVAVMAGFVVGWCVGRWTADVDQDLQREAVGLLRAMRDERLGYTIGAPVPDPDKNGGSR